MKNTYRLPDHHAEQKRSHGTDQVLRMSFEMPQSILGIGNGRKYYLHTYGCQANVRDGETIAGMMDLMGFTETESKADADVLIFNTCAVRKAAEDHVLGEVGQLKTLKKQHPDRIFVLCGCMAQEESTVQKLIDSYPQVDLIFGTHNLYQFPELLQKTMQNHSRTVQVESLEGEVIENMPVHRRQSCKGFVNIMYGCNKFCTYCIVPYTRGQERSRRMEDIVREITQLKESGAREAVLLGQNVNAYGKDLGMADGFSELLAAAADTGIDRIRFYTSHPRDYTEASIEVMKKYPNIMKSLHLPVQSGSNEILRRMARGYTVQQYRDLYDRMKQLIPDMVFTTDLIVGFPGETDAQFEETLALADYCQFDLAYTFVYSPREKTPAASMPDDVPAEVKAERLQILNRKISEIANRRNQLYVGRTVKVLCEGASRRNPNTWSGYCEENKLVNFTGKNLHPGDICSVEITEARSFSLDGHTADGL